MAFDETSAHQLRSILLDGPWSSWIPETIAGLPHYWKAVSQAIPRLQHYSGVKVLEDLGDWLRTGAFTHSSFPLPNSLLTPLVVISHLIQYSQFLNLVQSDSLDHRDLSATFKKTTETLGLCTGLLSAVAASCSENQLQLQRFGAVAIRLAMLIGAVIDSQDTLADHEGESKSFSVAWSSSELGVRVTEVLDRFPQAYISVILDKNRATVTASKSIVLSLQQELKTAGVSVADISLRGRFHNPYYTNELELLIKFCDSHSALQFPDASELVMPTRSNTGGDYIKKGRLHHHILRSMLVEQSDWRQAFAKLQSISTADQSLVVSFGSDSYIPHSLVQGLGSRYIQLIDLDLTRTELSISLLGFKGPSTYKRCLSKNGVAVIGMSCQLPGAADLEEFWKLLCTAKSQHIEVPRERFSFETAWRDTDPKKKWYGNFIQDYNAFDHKFFKKSPREMASTDPQHRLILQAAYQAVEQSGYFNHTGQNKHIGCYVGVGLVDYERNIACVPSNAYSATGNLKSFVAGKISHYFGWTGPSLTVDTACSSSAVAIHLACRAILSGECTAALAGGVNVMTSPEWFQNLAGASFLSTTGQCKPFDTKADGYCRGEGVGTVFLKKLSSAITDGDQIIGVIGSSNVYQNENCTPITVPNASSLTDLFHNTIRHAKIEPNQISYVEAHGTGTPVGDPAEYESICKILGGCIRSNTLSLGSVKGLLGHTESASGVVALIKILLMIQEKTIPPQASFDEINPSIKASTSDKIEITKSIKPWYGDFRAALINNYGASGSNACLVVTQLPQSTLKNSRGGSVQHPDMNYPFWFCGNDEQNLRAYSTRFRKFLQSNLGFAKNLFIKNLAFQLSRQSNRSHSQALIFCSSSVKELEEQLTAFERGEEGVSALTRPSPRPVILCFGGQISTFVGLDRQVHEEVTILRKHLDQCNNVCRLIGIEGIYPEIFQRSPVEDIVKLQVLLFAIQYSCAKSWMDCGVQVTAVVGFSFGELTALCVSGVLSLHDAIKMVASRARLIQDRWGTEKGAMLAVEADLEMVKKLLVESSKACVEQPAASIACYNGRTSFTVAGTDRTIDVVIETAAKDPTFSMVRSKKLNVTHAFHSTLVEPLMPDLKGLCQDIKFSEPEIPLERATEFESTDKMTSSFAADHMRNPVYFSHAVKRLSQRYRDCIWLEAGSNSTITTIASRALGMPKSSHFQSISITGDKALNYLTEATANLWREGLNVSLWQHHSLQRSEYDILLIPPYQFEKSKHWIELKSPPRAIAQPVTQAQILERPKGLWSFLGYQDKYQHSVRFRVNTTSQVFEDHVSGHIIAQSAPLCPSTLQLSIAIDALMSLHPASADTSLQPQVQGLVNHAPMSMDPSRSVWLDAEMNDASSLIWDWKMNSTSGQDSQTASTLYISGRIKFRSADDPEIQSEFAKYSRLVGRSRCKYLLNDADADELIKGIRIYQKFAEIVEYNQIYQGVQKLVSKGNESAGYVVKKYNPETWLDTGLADSFCQVAGIFVNSMTNRSPKNMYISDRIDHWIRSPELRTGDSRPETWEVLAINHQLSEKKFISDVFIFDPRNGALLEVILGIHYQMVSKASLSKVLSKLTPSLQTSEPAQTTGPRETEVSNGLKPPVHVKDFPAEPPRAVMNEMKKETKSSKHDISGGVRDIIVNLSGLDPAQIKDNSDLADLGIDSLMAMELGREIEIVFKFTLQAEQFLDLTDFHSLVTCIQKTMNTKGEVSAEDDAPAQVDPVDGLPKVNGAPQTNGSPQVNGVSRSPGNLQANIILEAFGESKQATDDFISEYKMGGYVDDVLPKSTELCVAHIVDAFEELGISLGNAKPGQKLSRIDHLPRHEQFVNFLYDLLEKDARLIDTTGSEIKRTAISIPKKSAQALLQDLVRDSPDHTYDHKLTYLTGAKLAECLTGKADAIQLIFGNPEGREIVSGMYGKSPINLAWVKQMEDFLERLLTKLSPNHGSINILEMGAGTGGTTALLVPLLASLKIPIRYTVTDLSASLVAAARKRFKDHSFVEFRVFDIEKPPAADLLYSQHIIIATNCIHATHNLKNSTKNIRDVLRPDGFLMMLEMTQTLPWIDLIFGLLEGWWLFDDGRRHALVPPSVWEETLQTVGYGHVDWTEGKRPEANVQRLIIALASGPRYDRSTISPETPQDQPTDFAARQAVVDAYIQQYTQEFKVSVPLHKVRGPSSSDGEIVVVTGATGSLGSHLVAYLAKLPQIKVVICLNRYSSTEPQLRQQQALKSKGITLGSEHMSKLRVIETDTAKPMLGLPRAEYEDILDNVTYIIHNAWPMSITRGIKGFASQFKVMQNLIEVAREISCRHPSKIGFQFISSIATVGCYPLWSGTIRVPEERMTVGSVLPTGYGDAKLVCERMLDETLHKYPDRFRAMSVRIGQIAGSTSSGYWNPVEHFAFLIKSSQTLKALPRFEGVSNSYCD